MGQLGQEIASVFQQWSSSRPEEASREEECIDDDDGISEQGWMLYSAITEIIYVMCSGLGRAEAIEDTNKRGRDDEIASL
jgi:hypothetical protein